MAKLRAILKGTSQIYRMNLVDIGKILSIKSNYLNNLIYFIIFTHPTAFLYYINFYDTYSPLDEREVKVAKSRLGLLKSKMRIIDNKVILYLLIHNEA